MFALFLSLFVLICLVLVVVVLLQSSKGGGLAGAFGGGGGSDSSLMGGRSAATFLSRITVYLAGSFMFLALLLSILSSRSQSEQTDSVIQQRQQQGALDVYNVEEGTSILDNIQTEGFDAGESDAAVQDGEEPAGGGDTEGN